MKIGGLLLGIATLAAFVAASIPAPDTAPPPSEPVAIAQEAPPASIIVTTGAEPFGPAFAAPPFFDPSFDKNFPQGWFHYSGSGYAAAGMWIRPPNPSLWGHDGWYQFQGGKKYKWDRSVNQWFPAP